MASSRALARASPTLAPIPTTIAAGTCTRSGSKEQSSADPTRHEKAQRKYFSRLAVAYLAKAQAEAQKGKAPEPIEMPSSRAFVLRPLGRFPVQVAMDTYLRQFPGSVRGIRSHLARHPGAWARFAAWVAHERKRAALRTPNPLAVPDVRPDAKPGAHKPGHKAPHHKAHKRAHLPAGPAHVVRPHVVRRPALPAGPAAPGPAVRPALPAGPDDDDDT